MVEKFPHTKFYNNLETPSVNVQIVAYIHTLIIYCLSLAFFGSVNTREVQHKSTIVAAYCKMKIESFKTQLTAVLRTYYEAMLSVQRACG